MTDEQTTDDLIKQINAHPRSALIEALADAMHSIEDDDGNGRHISYYRSLAFATVEVLPALSYDENELCNEPGCGAHRPAGPAMSSASTSGTGGLTDTTNRMLACTQRLAEEATSGAQYLTRIAEEIREEVEGQRRAVWDALVLASRTASESYSNGIAYAYYLLTGLDGGEIDRRLDAELDSRYGTDRAKGGERRG